MKTIRNRDILVGLLCTAAWSAQGQGLVLNAGDTYTFEFSTLPFQQVATYYIGTASAEADLYWTAVPLADGTQLQVAMFENSPSESPINVHTWTSASGLSGNMDLHPPMFQNVWQDLQGAFSLTVLSGSASINDVDLFSYIPIDSTHANLYHQQITLVPEPTSGVMLATAGIAGLLWTMNRRRKHVASHTATRDGAFSSASRFTSFGPAWLSVSLHRTRS